MIDPRILLRDAAARSAGIGLTERPRSRAFAPRRLAGRAALALMALLAGAGLARAETLTVDFGKFPKEMDCKVSGTSGKVTVRRGRELEYFIRGDVAGTTLTCALPDGRSFSVAPGAWYVPGAPMTAVQINADDRAFILSDAGNGLTQSTLTGVLNWK